MKKYLLSLLVLAFAVGILSGCAGVWPNGAFYTEIKLPIGAGAGDVKYSKIGIAKASSVLGLVATGDASVQAAMQDGGIREIKYVDYEAKSILGLFGEYTTTVYGD
jgi:TRL (tRNA-associated locus)-like protein